ncbi:peptidoglycan/LPS O-acetylase OafA/YrhL [Pseudomonas sp. 29]|uniref:acyltransferase family protein n=1 Tax=Pseudomonas sp. 29 TaxID=2035197 RepID=UPI000C194E66|nr:acyltransferase [Pseudomonas sp. 29]PIF52352.1 peptidoglycan/LPS O-acetylase OafA/YrhL [Pseudomonas sp. 29]
MNYNKESVQYIKGLDGLRAIAVLLVTFFHYSNFFPELKNATLLSVPWGVFSVGWVGVDIFFVLSGYLIAKMLLRNPISSPKTYAAYIAKRAKRLLPAYLACSIICISTLYAFSIDQKILDNQYLIWTLSSNTPTIFGERSALGGNYITLVHFWSLALEWQFYITFPVALAITRSARTTAIIAVLIAITSRMILMFIAPQNFDNAIYAFTLCRGDSLAFGVLIATLDPAKYLKHIKPIGLFGSCLLLAILFTTTQHELPFKSISWLQSFGYTAIAAASAMIIFSVANLDKNTIPIRLLESSPMTTIGRYSYSIYIWHLPMYPLIAIYAKQLSTIPYMQMLISFVIAITFTALASSLSYNYLEKRFMYARPIN